MKDLCKTANEDITDESEINMEGKIRLTQTWESLLRIRRKKEIIRRVTRILMYMTAGQDRTEDSKSNMEWLPGKYYQQGSKGDFCL